MYKSILLFTFLLSSYALLRLVFGSNKKILFPYGMIVIVAATVYGGHAHFYGGAQKENTAELLQFMKNVDDSIRMEKLFNGEWDYVTVGREYGFIEKVATRCGKLSKPSPDSLGPLIDEGTVELIFLRNGDIVRRYPFFYNELDIREAQSSNGCYPRTDAILQKEQSAHSSSGMGLVISNEPVE